MGILLGVCLTSFVIAFLAIPSIIKVAVRRNLLDAPGRRKVHKVDTPHLGGIAIFAGFLVSALIWVDLTGLKEFRFIVIPFLIIFLTGLRDDLNPIRPVIKLSGQIVAAISLLALIDIRLHSFYGLMGINEWPVAVSYIVSIFTIIVITNSFNLIDGLDGLAGSISLTSLLAFGIWFYLTGDNFFSVLSFAMAGAILAFLIYNWEPSDIFMGDTGSMVVGLLLSILVIHFINSNYNLPSTSPYHFSPTITTAACFVFVPLLDTLRIVILRMLKGQSLFRPDKSHIHHTILGMGYSHSRTTVLLVIVQLLFIFGAVLFRDVEDRIMLPLLLALATGLSLTLSRMAKRKVNTKGS